jgi:hypothetical protein
MQDVSGVEPVIDDKILSGAVAWLTGSDNRERSYEESNERASPELAKLNPSDT